MSKRVLGAVIYPSAVLLQLKFCIRSFSSTNSLEGLISHPEFEDPKQVSAQDFQFLRDSVSSDRVADVVFSDGLNDAFSIIAGIKKCNDGLGKESQKFLRPFRCKLDSNLVVDVIRNVQNVGLGVQFFIWAGRQLGYSHGAAVYDALLDLLIREKSDRIEDHFLVEIRNDDAEVLGKLLNVLIRKCCLNGMWNMALEELRRLKDFGYKPSSVTYNSLVRVFLEAGKLNTASLLHKEMINLGFKLDLHILGFFVHFLCKKSKWIDALKIIEIEGVQLDTVIYTKMIMGLCDASLFEEAMEFLDRMRSDSCVPNVITYKALLCGCLNKGKLGRCKRILNMMMTEGCYPSPKIFCSLVHAYCQSGDHLYAFKLFKKMEICGIKPGYVVYNIFIGSICSNGEFPSVNTAELGEKAYAEMLEAGVALNRINTSNFACCLCKIGKYEKAYRVIREMMENGFIPEAGTYNKVISFLCDGSKLDKALLMFQEMKSYGIVPNIYTYSLLIDRFCKAGLIEQARSWFDEMSRNGCAPNVVTYTAIIHAYLKAKKTSEANEIFEMMMVQGCPPNIVTFTALIDGFCKAGNVGRACAIYQKMRGNSQVQDVDIYFKLSSDGEKEPNVITYGALVDGLCKVHKVREARNLLDAMTAQNCEPNHIVYDALIDGFCKAGKLDEAQEVLAKMSEGGYSPNLYTYSSLIDKMFKDKRLDLALKVLAKMLENSCPPNVVIYTEMIDGLCNVGKTPEAYKLMLMMDEKGCKPNVVTYTAMIDGFGKAGNVDKSIELFNEMINKGCAPTHITYEVLIKHCCNFGRLDEAYRLLEEMKRTYWPMLPANYHKVMEGFSQEFIQSLQLVDEIGKNDFTPLLAVYKILIENFRKAGRLEIALKLHKELSSFQSSSFIDQKVYSSLIGSLLAAQKVDEAFELCTDMTRKGNIPEFGVFVNLIKGLINVNRWEDAFLLSESICRMDIKLVPNVSEHTKKHS